MRTLAFISISFVAFFACFLAYLHFQPVIAGSSPVGSVRIPDEPLPDSQQKSLIGNGKGVWFVEYDRNSTLKPIYQFRAAKYDRQPDGVTVRVTLPVVEFFQTDGQITHIEGEDGVVRINPAVDRPNLGGTASEPPRYGSLRNVTVKVYASAKQQLAGQEDLTITMANAQFDNDTFRMFTEEYKNELGIDIPADRVPIKMWSKDYIFEGSGLMMYWSDVDRRLKSLDIAHAKELTILNPSAMGIGAGAGETPVSANPQPEQSSNPGLSVALPASTAPSASADTAVDSSLPRKRYTATIDKEVRVTQGDKKLYDMDQAVIDFIPDEKSDGGKSAAAPDAQSSASQAPSSDPQASASSLQTPAPPASTVAAAAPEPIVVRWKGRLHVVPTDPTAPPLAAGDSIVHLVGQPVIVRQYSASGVQTANVQCADLIYRTFDSYAHLIGNDTAPLILTQRRLDGTESAVSGQKMSFSRRDNTAIVEGEGSARLPDSSDPTSMLTAAWTKYFKVHLLPVDKDRMDIQSADLLGDVAVNHPKFDLNANELQLEFDPSARQPGAAKENAAGGALLHRLIATGDAACHMAESGQGAKSIAGQRIELQMAQGADGKSFAKTVQADGAVAATNDEQNIAAEHMTITLAPASGKHPASQPDQISGQNVELEHLTATGTVVLTGKESSGGSGDSLDVEMVDGHERVTLRGQPATVANKDSTITGPELHMSGLDQTSSVIGPGTLKTVQQSTDPSKPGRPLEVGWSQKLTSEGKTNQVDITGDAYAESQSPSGSVDQARSDEILLALADKPATQPSDETATSRPSAPPGANLADVDFMRDKQVRTISLVKNARLDSSTSDANGKLLRRSTISGDRIDYDNIARQLNVPGKGDMLIEDHQTPQAGNDDQEPSVANGRGTTRFLWAKGFTYDQNTDEARFEGDVIIRHSDNAPTPRLVRLDADSVKAEFAREAGAASRPSGGLIDGGGTGGSQLRHVTALGAVTVATQDTKIVCGQADYDPVTQRITCHEGDLGRVTLTDHQHGEANFSEIVFNVRTNTLERLVDVAGSGRR